MKLVPRLVALAGAGLLLVAAGAAVVANSVRRRLVRIDAPEVNEVALVAVFEPLYFRSAASSFRGGTIDCWYGGGTIDLRGATMDPSGARLRVRAVFGGGQIVVPESWNVSTRVVGIGGVGDARRGAAPDPLAPELTIEGTVVFGGFGVTSDIPEEQATQLRRAAEQYAERRARS